MPNSETSGTIIVLAMHGAPPSDFPPRELGEFMALHFKAEFGGRPLSAEEQEREHDLECQIVAAERTPDNDPYHATSLELARVLHELTGVEVIAGFNEFCAPTLHDALDEAASRQPEKIVVITPMLTAGGSHQEQDIPGAIEAARQRHPEIPIEYAWPFEIEHIARFLADQFYNWK